MQQNMIQVCHGVALRVNQPSTMRPGYAPPAISARLFMAPRSAKPAVLFGKDSGGRLKLTHSLAAGSGTDPRRTVAMRPPTSRDVTRRSTGSHTFGLVAMTWPMTKSLTTCAEIGRASTRFTLTPLRIEKIRAMDFGLASHVATITNSSSRGDARAENPAFFTSDGCVQSALANVIVSLRPAERRN